MPKKTKKVPASEQLAKKQLMTSIEDQREALLEDLRQLNDQLERLEKQNVEWVKTITGVVDGLKTKVYLLNELVRIQQSWEVAL